MRDHDDEKLNPGSFDLEDIIEEFGGTPRREPPEVPPPGEESSGEAPSGPDLPWPEAKRRPRPHNVVAFPGADDEAEEPDDEPVEPEDEPIPEEEPAAPPKHPVQREGNVLSFPGGEDEDDGPEGLEETISFRIDKLRKKADEYARQMFENEGIEEDADVRRAEKLIPGTDEEEPPVRRERRPRREVPPAPDTPPAELYRAYTKRLKGLRLMTVCAFLLTAVLLYATLAEGFHLPMPAVLGDFSLLCFAMAGVLGLVMLLGLPVLWEGLYRLVRLRLTTETLVLLSCIAVEADALLLALGRSDRAGQLPYCAAAALAVCFHLWGRSHKLRGQRLACKAAAAASEPYAVTLDQDKWKGCDTYAKWSGTPAGFGRQIQADDGAQRIYAVAVPLILMAAVLLALLASVGHGHPERIGWCLAANLTASAAFSGAFCFGTPWMRLCRRLAKSGAAIAGWDGVTGTGGGRFLLLSDTDLFPPGSVALNGIKIFGDFSAEKVVGITATLIRDSGCGLERIFHDLLRSQGAVFRRADCLTVHEGGLSATVRGERVLVGSAAFLDLMEVPLPQGLNIKNAVFCAINGELAGIFVLYYSLHGAVEPAIYALTHNRITPVMATRDFNLIPDMLYQRFKLPVDKMEYPNAPRRVELSDPDTEHSQVLSALLCREGLGPYAEAVVGGQRLRFAVRLAAIFAVLGGAVGVVLSFYMTFMGAFASLSPMNLLIFLLLWMVPTVLITGWVGRY